MPPVVPKCLALVLCDAVTRNPRTDEPSIVRAFEVFDIPTVPAITRRFSVWMQVTDGNGKTAMQLVIEQVPLDSFEQVTVVAVGFSLDFQNPNKVLEHVANFDRGIELTSVGRYRLRLTADGATIAQRYFETFQAP